MIEMSDIEHKLFFEELKRHNKEYDPEVMMIKRPFSSPGYHTTLKGGYVHPTRDSLTYAVALFDSGIDDNEKIAMDIVKKVISLQDTNRSNKTYGIWSWFYEEPLSKMSPPDWNWANFCGKELLQILLDYSNDLPDDLEKSIKNSIIHACNSIIKRNVSIGYTNIAIMSAYVTILAGELLGEKKIFDFGRNYLKRFYDYTISIGAFTEYNSPTYTMIALEDLSRMLNQIKDEDCLKMVGELSNMGWKCVAEHFHAHTNQWAGPHTRCYKTLQDDLFLSKIQLATGGAVKFLDDEKLRITIDFPRIKLKCPEEYVHYFREDKERLIVQTFNKGKKLHLATSYLAKNFALGSFNVSDLWNQRRALVAYLGDSDNPVYFYLRCLHDGYDYSSAVLHSVQYKGDLLGIIDFATNGGDTHCNLDMIKDATIKARDFRIRFEFGGAIDGIQLDKSENTFICKSNNVNIKIHMLYCCFGNFRIDYKIGERKDIKYADIILYSGDPISIRFKELPQAVCAFCLNINSDNGGMPEIIKDKNNEMIRVEYNIHDRKLMLEADMKAKGMSELFLNSKDNITTLKLI
ncbi:MAG: hypothetical protein QME45_07815 [Clostridiales bacterium]|nr:hypothetical protein [Clostridiales bacterium]